MLSLNIISKKLKRDIGLRAIYKSLVNIFSLIIISLLIYGLILVVSKSFLSNYYDDSMGEFKNVASDTENYDKKIKDINELVSEVELLQSKTTTWSYLIKYISDNIGTGMIINEISANKNNGSLIITGVAKTREDLFRLKDFINDSKYFGTVELPIETLLKKEDINFNINIKIASYEFDKIQK
ncbi:MAG: hypothetical protein ABH881_02165 [bacterium]